MPSKKVRFNRSKRSQNTLHFSCLEQRNLLAGISFDASTGVATIDGSGITDQVQLIEENSKVTIIYHSNEVREFDLAEINQVVFIGRGGDDWFRNASSVPSKAYGQLGNDILIGGESADRLFGGEGSDKIFGKHGDDFIAGEGGDDVIRGDNGDDQILGGDGADNITGGSGRDIVFGQNGADFLFGQSGDDFLSGGENADLITGDSGRDTIRGEGGNDRIWGGDDDDHLRGNDGEDRIVGGLGSDLIHGESGSDHLQGNEGNDRIFGSLGDDVLFGGSGDDLMVGNEGKDSLIGGDGNDFMLGNDDSDYLDGQGGHDQMHSGSGNDVLKGGSGRDKLFGQDGSDRLDGDSGNDDLIGGSGSDRLTGGQGNDDFSSDSSDDVFDDNDDYSSNDDFEIRGVVSNLNTSTKTFDVLGLTVNYSVAYVEGNFGNGSFVKTEGSYDGNQVLAKEVELEQNDDRRENIEARGVISNLDSSARTFEFLGFNVNYSAARVDGAVADSSTIKLEGRYDGAGNIVAHRIETANNGDDGGGDDGGGDNGGDNQTNGDLELRGLISNLDTSSRTFTLLGVQVDYSSAQIRGTLANGAFFKADGSYNGVLNAHEVEPEQDDDRDENVRAHGVVSDLDSQNQTFKLLGFTVDFSGAEIDDAFGNGTSVQVDGWFANGTINAEEVKR